MTQLCRHSFAIVLFVLTLSACGASSPAFHDVARVGCSIARPACAVVNAACGLSSDAPKR